jgi:hypothetical protein
MGLMHLTERHLRVVIHTSKALSPWKFFATPFAKNVWYKINLAVPEEIQRQKITPLTAAKTPPPRPL